MKGLVRFIAVFSLSFLSLIVLSCAGSANSSGNIAFANSSSSNTAANQATPTNVDTTPITMDRDVFEKADTKTLEGYQGRTMIVKNAIVNAWSEDSMTVFPKMGIYVRCNGDFGKYSDSIKVFQNDKTPATFTPM